MPETRYELDGNFNVEVRGYQAQERGCSKERVALFSAISALC
jgi:hypothetical protein